MDLREQHIAAWTERRDGETRAMLATAATTPPPQGKKISDDGACLVCASGRLMLVQRQPHLGRDWGRCTRCWNTMPCVEGVLRDRTEARTDPEFAPGARVRDCYGAVHEVREQVGCAVYVKGQSGWFHPTKLFLVDEANRTGCTGAGDYGSPSS